ncbi:flagellar hook-length control protein FliK [Pseudohongiella acticola]|jgi:flagellar hook-length control protein FliK|uniref:flagellar hook-length control protein FliK n=1 Tax=Pseudohongiella acticola TaxID=1524254 RepID=UPI0030ECFB29
MLVPVDLMSVVSAVSPAGKARDGVDPAAGAANSWLQAASDGDSFVDGNGMINKLFMSYANDGEANPEGRFAADLRALLSAHGVDVAADPVLMSQAGNDDMLAKFDGALSDLDWSVDELLQMSMGPLAGGNNLPVDDQSLPSVLRQWLSALSSPTGEAAVTGASGSAAADSPALRLLTGGAADKLSGGADLLTLQGQLSGQSLVSPLAQTSVPGSADSTARNPAQVSTQSLTSAGDSRQVLAGLSAGGPVAANGATVLGGTGGGQGHAALTGEADTDGQRTANPESRIPGDLAGEEGLAGLANSADTVKQATDTQLNPGAQKVSSDAANASVFRSIQFSQAGRGDGNGVDGGSEAPADLIKTSAPLERSQAVASQLSAPLSTGTGLDASLNLNSTQSQVPTPADTSTVLNRPEQRMLAAETAQQAQSQATQQSVTRTADGLPRFAMDTAFGQQGWSDSLGRQLLVMSSQGVSSAQIRLDPPELGSLTVKIQMSSDQQTSVNFVSQHAVVREVLEQQLNRLQDLFREQGLDLADVSVSDQTAQQQDADAEGEQGRAGDWTERAGDQDETAGDPVLVRSESLIDFYA